MKDRKLLKPEERLIVAADFKPEAGRDLIWAGLQVQKLARQLKGTGVCIKINSVLRGWGNPLIKMIHDEGLSVFADLKLADISETLLVDGIFLQEEKPELLTVFCSVGVAAMQILKSQLPATEALGVTVLTSLTKEEVSRMYSHTILDQAKIFTEMASEACIGGIICAPKEAGFLRPLMKPGMTINTPAIRPSFAIVAGDDQNPDRIMTPRKAILAGADRLVVGRPIIRAEKPYDAVMRTIEEIAKAMQEVA